MLQVENPLANEDGAKKNVSYAVENSDTESMCYRRGVPCLQKNIIEVFGSYPEVRMLLLILWHMQIIFLQWGLRCRRTRIIVGLVLMSFGGQHDFVQYGDEATN